MRAPQVGDRYEPYIRTAEGSRYIWLPMEISPAGELTLFNVSGWSLDDWPTPDEALDVWTWTVQAPGGGASTAAAAPPGDGRCAGALR